MQLASLRAAIVDRPWRSVGIALLAGACIGLLDSHRADDKPSLLGILLASLVRDVAKGETRSWLDAHTRPFAQA
ncbi:MAG: hypothetical protein IPQ07_14880 [Myxococcales bacterium]|nr:hypothetical protein [Myxococcales bacterium]